MSQRPASFYVVMETNPAQTFWWLILGLLILLLILLPVCVCVSMEVGHRCVPVCVCVCMEAGHRCVHVCAWRWDTGVCRCTWSPDRVLDPFSLYLLR